MLRFRIVVRGMPALLALLLASGCYNPFDKGDSAYREPPRSKASSEDKPWWKFWGGGDGASQPRQRSDDRAPAQASGYTASGTFAEATELVKQHQFDRAKTLLEQVVAENPQHAEAFRWLGDCQYNLMELEPAVASYMRARELDPYNYFALRGKGFAHLHLGHELWRRYEDALRNQDKDAAHEMLKEAHEHYKLSLEVLQQALKVFPGDGEAMYGRAMAAEGASRKLYANAVGLLRKGDKENAHAWAENCIDIIDEGIEAAKLRVKEFPDRAGPRKLVGGLFFRRAMLLKTFGEDRAALDDLQKSIATQESILKDVDPNNDHARRELDRARQQLQQWQSES